MITRIPSTRLTLAPLVALAWAAGCSGGDVECEEGTVAAPATICAPADAPADTPLTLRAREACGGCTQYATGCEVTRQGDVLTLTMIGDNCTLPSDYACPAICSVTEVDCQTPPLPAGTYTVEGLDPLTRTSTTPVVIEVGAGGGETDCALPGV